MVEGLTGGGRGTIVALQDTSANLGDALLAGLTSPSFSASPSVLAGCPISSAPTFSPDPIVGTADGQEILFEVTYTATTDDIGVTCSIDVGDGRTVDFEIGE